MVFISPHKQTVGHMFLHLLLRSLSLTYTFKPLIYPIIYDTTYIFFIFRSMFQIFI